jgi:hypothetical protein
VDHLIAFDWKDPVYTAWKDWQNCIRTMKASQYPHGWEEVTAKAMVIYETLRAQMFVARYY